MAASSGEREAQRPLAARLGLWRLTRHPAVRRLYDALDDRGLFVAQLDRFERRVDPDASGSLPRPPAGVTLTVERAADSCPERLAAAPLAPDDRVVVAWRDGTPVGHCCLSDRRVYVPELHRRLRPPGLYCWRLFVRPAARGRGIGRALVAAGLRESPSASNEATPGSSRASALVAPDNLPSRRLFRGLGFRPTVRHTSVGLAGRTWHRTGALRSDT